MGPKVFAQANFPARLIFLHSVVGAEVLNPGLKQGETQDRAGVHEWAKGRLAALQKELGGKLNKDSRVWGAEHQQGLAQEIASAEGEIRLVQAGDTLGAIAKGLGRLDYGSPVEYRGNSARLDRQRGLNPTGKLREADLVYPGQYVWREAGKVIVSEEAPNWVRGQALQQGAEQQQEGPVDGARPREEPAPLREAEIPFAAQLADFKTMTAENLPQAEELLNDIKGYLRHNSNAELQIQAEGLATRIKEFQAAEAAQRLSAEQGQEIKRQTERLKVLATEIAATFLEVAQDSAPNKVENQKAQYQKVQRKIETFFGQLNGVAIPSLDSALTELRIDITNLEGVIEAHNAYDYLTNGYVFVISELKRLGVLASDYQPRFDLKGNESIGLREKPGINAASQLLIDYLEQRMGYAYLWENPVNSKEVVYQHQTSGHRINLVLGARREVIGIANLGELRGPEPKGDFKTFLQHIEVVKQNEEAKRASELHNAEVQARTKQHREHLGNFLVTKGIQPTEFLAMLRAIQSFMTEHILDLIGYGKVQSDDREFRADHPAGSIEIEDHAHLVLPITAARLFQPKQRPDKQFVIEVNRKASSSNEFVLEEAELNLRSTRIATRFWDQHLRSVFWQQEIEMEGGKQARKVAAKVHLLEKDGQPADLATLVEVKKEKQGIKAYNVAGQEVRLHVNDRALISELFFEKLS